MSSEKAPQISNTDSDNKFEQEVVTTPQTIDETSSGDVKLYQSRGVRRVENVKRSMDSSKRGKRMRIMFCLCLLVCAWVTTLDGQTTWNYQPAATSAFNHHSMLATVQIATSIISSVSKPLMAKFGDITSRPITYIVVLIFYTLGNIITASSVSISAYIVGVVFIAVGSSGINLLNTILSADLTPLKYRGLLLGILSTPYLINAWFAGLIADAVLNHNWRWGYGMFAIIMPVSIAPAIAIMMYLEHTSQKQQRALGNDTYVSPTRTRKEWAAFAWQNILEVDLFGLILMMFGWSLLLLPFSLYTTAGNSWKNPSLIAMFVVGGVLLIIYAIYEFYFAPYPSMPKRVFFNRTFMTAVCIDFFYQFGGYLRLLYFSSYALVVTNMNYRNWTYFNNTFTMASCFFGVIVGLIQRYTHRTKYLQSFGLCLQVVAMILTFWGRYDNCSVVLLVWTQILIGMGGACSVVGSQVSSQASVPHQDTALVISLLDQWSSIGAAIGAAVAGAIWQTKMPQMLRTYMPSSVTDEQVLEYYGSVIDIFNLPYDSPERQGAMLAYFHTTYYLYAPALALTCIPFVCSFFQRNFYLGDDQNGIETKDVHNKIPETRWQKFVYFLDEPLGFIRGEHKVAPANVVKDDESK